MAQTVRGPDDAAVADVPAEATIVAGASVAEERVSVASQWQLMWWRFRKHKLAMIEEAEGGARRRRPWRVVAVGSR